MVDPRASREIFSFHLARISLVDTPHFLLSPMHRREIPGLKHSESLIAMTLGESIASPRRYHLTKVGLFAWWSDETHLDDFLKWPDHRAFADGWHVRMKLYRRWGRISELDEAVIDPELAPTADRPVVAVTLARLNLFETSRFIRWGKPVERQVRDHVGQVLALAAIRPLNTFSTFSIWKNEAEMIDMVHGRNKQRDGEDHRLAMEERTRRDFHHEFTTLRFAPFKEAGSWNGTSDYIGSKV